MSRFPICIVAMCATGVAARADVFAHEEGFALQLVGGLGLDTDDMAVDFAGGHSLTALEIAYRAKTGTELVVMAGLGTGGHEGLFPVWGAAARQRFRLGDVEPFVTAGVFEVGDDVRLPPALGIGLGADLRLTPRVFSGAAVHHYFSDDSDRLGGLDWSVAMHVGLRIGESSR